MRHFDAGPAFAEALEAFHAGRLDAAKRICRLIQAAQPRFGGAHYLLGLIALAEGQPKRAVEHLQKAVAQTPTAPAPRIALARALAAADKRPAAIAEYGRALAAGAGAELHAEMAELLRRDGRLAAAIDHCRQALAAKPDEPAWLTLLGGLLQQAGRPAEAVEPLSRAVALNPASAAAHNNLGLALRELGRMEAAAERFAAALQLNPDSAGAHANLAGTLRALGRADEALGHARRATELNKGDATVWLELALAQRAAGGGGREALEAAVGLDPKLAHAHHLLGEIAVAAGEADSARRHFRRYLRLDPEDRHGAALRLALLDGEAAPDRAPPAYVRTLFDQYADRFDAELLERLRYRPDLLRAAAEEALNPAPGSLDILDIGCGTGLGGVALKPLARKLDGTDLSPRMIEKAAARGIYDDLAVGDLVAVMAGRPARYDLVIAADVLVYVGPLEPALTAAHAALRPGGAMALSVERAESGVVLGRHSRYAHGEDYLRRAAAQAGFEVALLHEIDLRQESGAPVGGWMAVLRRS